MARSLTLDRHPEIAVVQPIVRRVVVLVLVAFVPVELAFVLVELELVPVELALVLAERVLLPVERLLPGSVRDRLLE